jgi:hypothetical protein
LTLLDFESMTNPAGLDPSLNPFGKSPLGQIVNCRVVPGSERVYGPDMNPGSTYGYRTLYRRAPANTDPNDLGPNEYLIRYEALRTAIPYTPTGDPRVDAMEVARRAAGTIIFPSGEGVPGGPKRIPRIDANNDGIADVPITVDYKIQNNLRTDVVKADYLTRQLMTLNVGIRLYDFSSGQPQQFNVSQKIHIRNLQR